MARYRRARSYAKRGYSRAKKGLSGMGISISPATIAGLIIGYTNLDDKIPKGVTLTAAVAPVKGLGKVQTVARGIMFGNMIQAYTGRTGGGSLAGGFKGV